MLIIQENINGTLYVKDGVKIVDTIEPQYNLDESVELLKQFNKAIINDKKLQEKWSYNGYFILPALQEWIFWDYFVPIIKYKKLFQNNYVNKINFSKSKVNEGLIGLFKYRNITKKQPNIILRIIKKTLLNILQFIYPIRENILIYDDGLYGFRYTKVKELLATEISYTRIHLLNKKDLFSFFKNKALYYGFVDIFIKKSDFSATKLRFLNSYDKYGHLKFINNLNIKCNEIINAVNPAIKLLNKNKTKLIFGYDQLELILPLIIAAKILKIKIVTYQHGVITKYHAGWIGHGIKKELCNIKADKLIVWGELWKKIILENSSKYLEENLVIGRHLNKDMNISQLQDETKVNTRTNKPISLLYPYEFMANHKSVGSFLRKFINSNVKITIKVRKASINDPAGGNISRDSLSYDEDLRSKIKFVNDIETEKIRENFDAVICSQSTYALEMMKYGLPIWYLFTDFNFIDFINTEKIAHLLKIEEIEEILKGNMTDHDMFKTKYDYKKYCELFNQKKSDMSLIKQILE